MRDLVLWPRDGTWAPCAGSSGSEPLGHQGNLLTGSFLSFKYIVILSGLGPLFLPLCLVNFHHPKTSGHFLLSLREAFSDPSAKSDRSLSSRCTTPLLLVALDAAEMWHLLTSLPDCYLSCLLGCRLGGRGTTITSAPVRHSHWHMPIRWMMPSEQVLKELTVFHVWSKSKVYITIIFSIN